MDISAAAPALSAIARMKINAELMGLVRQKVALLPTEPMAALKGAQIAAKINKALAALGIDLRAKKVEPVEPVEPDDADDGVEDQPRQPSDHLYEFNPLRKLSQRKKDNAAAMALLAKIDAGEVDGTALTDDQKAALARYSGTGGALVGADGKKGSAFEYYTPKPVAEGMWDLLRELGFSGGKVLDPSAGVGIFGGTAPKDAAVDSVELNETSGRINALVNQGPGYTVEISPFEKIAAATPDEVYDAVITNVPFGSVADRGGNELGDKRYQKEPLQNYFILRSLEKLRPGGLAAFIVPPRCTTGRGGKEEELRSAASFMAEFLGAYRLPNSVFGTANADTITDVIVFRKFSRDAAQKIEELREQNPAKLVEAKVLWPEYIGGKYFMGEGKRFVLGELILKDPNKYRDVDRVVNNGSVADIAKLLRKFPDSRIDWDMLEEAETQPIIYAEGDTVTQKGQTLQFKDGAWVAIKSNEASPEMLAMGGKVGTPLQAFNAGITFAQAEEYVSFMLATSQALDIPDWVRGACAQIKNLPDEADRARYWSAGIVGMSVAMLTDMHQGEEVGFNYLEEYPALSEAMKRVASDAKSCPGSVGGAIKSGMKALGVHYAKRTGYSGVWSGAVQTDGDDQRTADQKFEGVKYEGQGLWVDRDQAAKIYGSNFDPVADADWCISDDGKQIAKADDYFIGNYGDMLTRLDAAAKAATDPVVRGKLLAQRAEAEKRVERVDVSAISFNLFSPYVTVEEKAEFMRRFVSPHFAVAYDEKTGKAYVECTLKKAETAREKLLKRMEQYLQNGTVTLGGAQVGDQRRGIASLREMIATANEQFDGWSKANPAIMGRLSATANDPARLYFRQVEDESPINIPGLSGNVKPHGYQNSFIRRMGRNFSGINGFSVGLGKTMSALLSVQHVQSIGVKKKTAFIVPNSVLSNWRKEATKLYASTDDCLFVGLDVNPKTGKAKVSSANYDRDLNIIMENRHKKIFMTMEAFERLRLRDETVDNYETFLRSVDSSFAESEDKKADEVAKGKSKRLVAMLTEGKSAGTPFLEDLGIDSLVSDESHAYKNSASTVGFKSAKFLALPGSADRGVDAQAKAWYIRSKSPLKDGVLLLTATPITNSPLEVYSMLSLAVGRDRVNDMVLGIKGADNFMEVMCNVDSQEDETMDGVVRDTRIFNGLNNVNILRKAIGDVAVIRDAASVGQQVKLPDADEVATPVALPDPPVLDTLVKYKGAFRYAIDMIAERPDNRGDQAAFEEIAAKFGEPIELIGHPFNLINKMTMLIMDPELDERATFYSVSKAEEKKAQAVVDAFNAKKYTEERARPGPHTSPAAVVGQITRKDGEDKETFLKIEVQARLENGRIVVDTITPETQSAFEALADKAGVDLDVSVPPKLAALLENFTKEETNPRGVDSEGNKTPRVKQLIFCDILPMHNKIKRLLTKRAGVPSSAIAIVTGKQNNKPDEILAVQDGFNADGEDNKYRVVIANEKAEVGINLQQGTQAIHHLTTGWTPDSKTQRDGRGVRQGNKTDRVTVYSYDADGTFDSHKRQMVSVKAGWIDEVMDVNGSDSVSVEGGMSREQLEALIDTVGDADAMTRLQETLAAKEREVRAVGVRAKQLVNMRTVQASNEFLAANPDAKAWAGRKFAQLYTLRQQVSDVELRVRNPKISATALVKGENLLADLNARLAGLSAAIGEALIIKDQRGEPASIGELMTDVGGGYRSRGVSVADKAYEAVAKGYSRFKIEINPESTLANEWQAEVDMTKAMIKEAKSAFTRQSKEDGAMPKTVMDAYAEGKGVILDGKPIVEGAFIRMSNGGLAVVRAGGLEFVAWSEDGLPSAGRTANMSQPFEVVLPGTAGYDAAVTQAAQIEDAISKSGNTITVEQQAKTYSGIVPEVSQRRTTVSLIECDTHFFGLPAPFFPEVVDPAKAALGPVFAAIVASQSAVIKGFNSESWSNKFTVEANQGVVKFPGIRVDSGRADQFIAYARANGLKINMAEWKAHRLDASNLSSRIGSDLSGLDDALNPQVADSEEAAQKAAADWVRKSLPEFDLGETDPLTLLPVYAQVKLQSAIKRLMSPPQVPVAEALQQGAVNPIPAAGSVAAGPIGPDDMIGISGNTRTWKDKIKDTASSMGSRAIWDGDALAWNVPYKVWGKLAERYPNCTAEGELTMVEFSGKARYSKRK